MNIPPINALPAAAEAPAGTAAARPAPAPEAAQSPVDTFTQAPQPPRFPWMNWHSRQLADNAAARTVFPDAPVLGDHLDKTA